MTPTPAQQRKTEAAPLCPVCGQEAEYHRNGFEDCIAPTPWKVEFALTGNGKRIIAVNSARVGNGGFYELCRQHIDGEPAEAIRRIKAEFELMASAPALAARVAKLEAALRRARRMLGPHSLHPDAEGFAIIDAALGGA